MAMLLALIGLAAFMARGRTREIGVRKVMGASVPQIVRLLLWQFWVYFNDTLRIVFQRLPDGRFQEYGENLIDGQWQKYFEDTFNSM